MRNNLLVAAAITCSFASGLTLAQEYTSDLDASLRIGLGLETEPNAQLTWNNYGSRLRWNGSADAGNGIKAVSYLEFGFNQDDGVGESRQMWIGVEKEGVGTFTGGKQYNAFYDAVSSAVDIANWGSCGYDIGCARQSSVLKFTTASGGESQFMMSAVLDDEDFGGDFIDQLDIGATLISGERFIGLGASLLIGNEFDVVNSDNKGNKDDSEIVEFETGIGAGISVTQPLAEGTASLTVQYRNEDYLHSTDNGLGITATFSKNQMYGILSVLKEENTPFYITLGYTKPLLEDKAYSYFELSAVDEDNGGDLDLQARAVMVFNMDVLSKSGELLGN